MPDRAAFLIDYPPLLDYPNHLARLYILSTHDADPVLSHIWRSDWHLVPNLAIDAIGPPLINFTSVIAASRLILIAIIAMFVSGTILLHRAIFAQRSYWPLLAGLLVYNAILLMGFVHFLFGSGLALVGTSVWVSPWRPSQRYRGLLSMLFSLLLFLSHIAALAFYLVFIGSWQLAKALEEDFTFRNVKKHLMRLAPAGAFTALLMCLYLMSSIHSGEQHPLGLSSIKQKATYFLVPFLNYSTPLDIITALLSASVLAWLFFRGKLELPKGTRVFLALFFVMYILCPSGTPPGGFLDARLPLLMAFVAIGGSRPQQLKLGARRAIATGAVIVLAVRPTLLAMAWIGARRDLQDFRSLEALIPQGARILATSVTPEEDKGAYFRDQPSGRELRGLVSLYYHLPAIWVIERKIFWPLLFSHPALQPVKALPPYDSLAVTVGLPPNYRNLSVPSAYALRLAP